MHTSDVTNRLVRQCTGSERQMGPEWWEGDVMLVATQFPARTSPPNETVRLIYEDKECLEKYTVARRSSGEEVDCTVLVTRILRHCIGWSIMRYDTEGHARDDSN
jgi:hypothetical protein